MKVLRPGPANLRRNTAQYRLALLLVINAASFYLRIRNKTKNKKNVGVHEANAALFCSNALGAVRLDRDTVVYYSALLLTINTALFWWNAVSTVCLFRTNGV